MKWTVFWHLIALFVFCASVFCGRNILMHEIDENQSMDFGYQKNDEIKFRLNDEKLLHRDKRYLLWTNGGISKVHSQSFCSFQCTFFKYYFFFSIFENSTFRLFWVF